MVVKKSVLCKSSRSHEFTQKDAPSWPLSVAIPAAVFTKFASFTRFTEHKPPTKANSSNVPPATPHAYIPCKKLQLLLTLQLSTVNDIQGYINVCMFIYVYIYIYIYIIYIHKEMKDIDQGHTCVRMQI